MDGETELSISVDAGADILSGMLDDDLETIGGEPNDAQGAAEPSASGKGDTDKEKPKDPEESEDNADDDAESEDDSDEEEETSTAKIDDDTLVDIKIGEEDYEVNFAELRAGYLRNEDYAAKVNQLHEEHEAKMNELEEKQEALLEELRAASVIVTADTSKYDQINWEALKAQDPARYAQLRVEALEAKEQATRLEQRRQQVNALHQKAQQIKFETYAKKQAELVEKLIPNIREPEVLQGLLSYGQEVGYTRDEVLGMVDSRQILLLHNAMLHAKSVVRRKDAEANKVSKDLPPVNKPGAQKPKSSTDRQVVKNARARLQSEQSVDAAAAVLATFDL
jgi:hypothetical protein